MKDGDVFFDSRCIPLLLLMAFAPARAVLPMVLHNHGIRAGATCTFSFLAIATKVAMVTKVA